MSRRPLAALAPLGAAAFSAAAAASGAEQPTFNREIAPLVFKNCAPCHRPGEAGPFSLLNYSDVRSHARQIVKVTARRYMPPWLPEPGKGAFLGERRLTDEQIALIRRWVEAGAPEGDPSELPPAPRFAEGWQLGEPDLVLNPPRPFALPADGPDVFWNLVYASPVATARYVRAMEIRLPDRKVGHHANLLLDRARDTRRLGARAREYGFPGMELTLESEGFDPDSHFLFWKPGSVPSEEPRGMAWRIDRRTDLVLNLHLRPSGKPESISPSIGLYFTDEAPSLHPMLLQLEHDGALDIPPGARSFPIGDDYVLPVPVAALGVYPHAHYLGKEVQGYATLPDGSRKWLIHIKDWDVNWQAVYRFKEPVLLPKGTTLSMRWTFDNTLSNPRNPSRPPRRVVAGNRAEDEMGHLWIQVLPQPLPGEADAATDAERVDPRLRLQEALMRRRLAKYPADFTAHYNLGEALQAEGRLDEATSELRAALKLRPAHPSAHNSLGAALQAQGRLDEAMREYRAALGADPAYASASYNLGQLLLAAGRPADAVRHYREALRLEPEDADLHAQLGAALQEQQELDEAVKEYREALARDPAHVNARYNLGRVLALQGQAEAAVRELRDGLARRPDDPDLRDALGLAFVALGRPEAAIPEFRAALRSRVDDPGAHDALGQLLFAAGAVDEAILHFQEALRSRPDDADLCNNLGSALAARGRLAEAAHEFEQALRIDPGHEAAKANLARARGQEPRQ